MSQTHSTHSKNHLYGFAKILVMEGMLKEEDAIEAWDNAAKGKKLFVNHLVENKILNPRDIARIGSHGFGVPMLDLNSYDTKFLPLSLVDKDLIKRHQALPLFKRGERLYIALSDPSKQVALDEIKFHTGLRVQSIIVEHDKLIRHIEEALNAKEDAELGDFLSDYEQHDQLDVDPVGENATDDEPIVRFVSKILIDAIHKGASDIHFEPYEDSYRIRYRIDGLLVVATTPPSSVANRICSRIKILAQLDISERRIPQDGRYKMKLISGNAIDFRVSTCPTVNGEKIVMRILDPGSAKLGIDALGFDEVQKQNFLKAIHQPQGMVLVTGPTGSGKTVTLYTALNLLNQSEKNISTAEDPVEIKVQGINQVNINVKAGLNFSKVLRSFLRQDPDIIMIGEMRDLETAEIGIKAAQTGHMVLSTLHTNSAPGSLSRLINMGIPSYNIASSVSLIIAQRLARRLCDKCKKPASIPRDIFIQESFTASMLEAEAFYTNVGCEDCTNGYKGRVGLFEVLVMTKEIGEIIMKGGTSLDLTQQAFKQGMITIRESGLNKVKAGITTLEEINRVTKD